ncbi:MAG TPA: ATP-binding protein [Candidatus Deferrimicrobiaceae bacterium]|jgi:signal transduction histidine kinase|nr:ATP-binding protein [Candidatus Deferrimicrobiaceae bacterium]
MVDTSELRRVSVFADLPDDQLTWFISQSQELVLKAGDVYSRQGDPADAMFVILEGQLQGRGELNGETFVFDLEPGDVTGVLPFSRMKQFTVGGRAVTDAHALRFSSALFPELVQKMPELTKRLVGLMSDRIRETTRLEQQRDRLASLGKLSAGLAHELNNPASAAKRAASQLRDILKKIRDASLELGRRDLTPAQKSEIEKLEASFTQTDVIPPDALTVNDLEDQIDSLLRSHGQKDLWLLAAALARRNIKPEVVESLFATLEAGTARAALVRIAASVEVATLLHEIESSTSRISDLVGAIKEYTYMDQSPVQNVDVVKSLETTLTILNHKLKKGVVVQRDYQRVPLLVNSFGSELNQVWTNIIDNAIDAMHGKGELRVRTYREDGCVVVEIGDNGPGIPEEVQPHIFEPFFTTKGVGEGTGLGLDTVQRIVKKHRGNIQVTSNPGNTRFQVWLPLAEIASQ